MKITKNFQPIASAISAALVISVLAYLTLETSAGIWLMFSFGATVNAPLCGGQDLGGRGNFFRRGEQTGSVLM